MECTGSSEQLRSNPGTATSWASKALTCPPLVLSAVKWQWQQYPSPGAAVRTDEQRTWQEWAAPFPSHPCQLLLCVQRQIGETGMVGGPTKWGSTESLEDSQVSRVREREEGPLGALGSWRVEPCTESQGQPLRSWVGGHRGLQSSPPALAQRCIPTPPPPPRGHPYSKPRCVHSPGQAEGWSGSKLKKWPLASEKS